MDREIPVANRVIDKKMQQFRTKKHRQTLSQIRNKSSNGFHSTMYQETPPKSNHHRYNSTYLQNKNLQIQKQNIKLFNKIASIIREKPRVTTNNSCGYAQSFQEAALKHKKLRDRIKTQNQVLQKRISQQKPTIQNKLFFKDRMKNVKYLKLIGRYPYQNSKKPQNENSHTNQNSLRTLTDFQTTGFDIQIFRKRTDDFFVKIIKITNNYYVFNVQAQGTQKVFQYMMNKQTYEEEFMKCGYSYDKMIGNLRLNQNQQVVYQYTIEQQQCSQQNN